MKDLQEYSLLLCCVEGFVVVLQWEGEAQREISNTVYSYVDMLNNKGKFNKCQLYGLEKFWAYLKYSKSKNHSINPKLADYLCSFKRLEDFRVEPAAGEESGTKRTPSNSASEERDWLKNNFKPSSKSIHDSNLTSTSPPPIPEAAPKMNIAPLISASKNNSAATVNEGGPPTI